MRKPIATEPKARAFPEWLQDEIRSQEEHAEQVRALLRFAETRIATLREWQSNINSHAQLEDEGAQ